jgi:hypothetical protein
MTTFIIKDMSSRYVKSFPPIIIVICQLEKGFYITFCKDGKIGAEKWGIGVGGWGIGRKDYRFWFLANKKDD